MKSPGAAGKSDTRSVLRLHGICREYGGGFLRPGTHSPRGVDDKRGMRVESSTLALAAAHRATELSVVHERRQVRRPAASTTAPQDSTEITDAKTLIAMWLYEFLTGHRMKLKRCSPSSPQRAASRQAPSVRFSRREIRHERETTAFAAEGRVVLESGETISFSLRLRMNRQQTEVRELSFQAGEMSDPIAVNLDGLGVRLSGERAAFDLDGDGIEEMVATLAEGSAWLAWDRDGNQQIDSGVELFGPSTGDGFGELAAADVDGNGWIDEGDAAYQSMGLWRDGRFTSLQEAGIGALAAASVATPFALQQGAELLGQIRQTGVYLREDGAAGLMQQVDLSVVQG